MRKILLALPIVFIFSSCDDGEAEIVSVLFIASLIFFVILFFLFRDKQNTRSKSRKSNKLSQKNSLPLKNFVSDNGYKYSEFKYNNDYVCVNVAVKGLYYRTNKEQYRASKLNINEPLFIEHESSNPVDKYALKVITSDGYFIGYVDSFYSERFYKLMSNNLDVYCFVSKNTGGDIPYVYMNVFYNKNDLQKYMQKETGEQEQHKVDLENHKVEQRRKYLQDLGELSPQERIIRIRQLKRNIERAEAAIVKFSALENNSKLNNAIKNHQKHQEEVDILYELEKKDT